MPDRPHTRTLFAATAIFAAFAICLLLVDGSRASRTTPQPIAEDGIVRVESAYKLGETIARLKQDIAAKGIMFFQEVDQTKLAADAGIKIRPSTLLTFGNPALGTLFVNARPEAGIDWPVRLAGAAGRGRPGVACLYRFSLDRPPASHHRARRALQDGRQGHRLDHGERGGQIAGRPAPAPPARAPAGA